MKLRRDLTLALAAWLICSSRASAQPQVYNFATIAGLVGSAGSADGRSSDARFFEPFGIALDGSGSVYVADSYNFTIRQLTPLGTNWVSSTIAGLAGVQG